MKRRLTSLICLLLCLTTLLPACAKSEPEKMTETVTEDLTEKEALPGQLTAQKVSSLPIASQDMTPQERRKLCLDYFRLQLTFRWKPGMDVLDYPTTYASFKNGKTIEDENLYAGIPYQSTGTGNLYRWLEYYDEKSGVMDLERAFEENGGYGDEAAILDVRTDENGLVTYKKYRSLMTLFNQCSVASFWGWGRVVNSASFAWTSDMTVYNGFIPVGGYTYDGALTLDRFGEKTRTNPDRYDTKDVIRDWNDKNGIEGMYKCYAQMKPGDCVVSPGHTMMIHSVSFFKRADGSISYPLSTAKVLEQTEGWGEMGQEGDKNFFRQGCVEKEYSFAELQKAGYIPFTFAELLDENDSQDKAHLDAYYAAHQDLSPVAKRYRIFSFTREELDKISGVGVEKATVFTTLKSEAKEVNCTDLAAAAVGSNYPISDVFVTLLDAKGSVLKENVFRADAANIREVKLSSGNSRWELDDQSERKTLTDGFSSLAGGGNRVRITLQLSTGEKLCAWEGDLI